MMKRLLIAFGLVGALVLGSSSSAFAHAVMTGADPADGDTLDQAPADITVEFSEELDGPSTEIAVSDPEGTVLDLEEPTFEGNSFTQPLMYNEPGEYTLAYRILSQDGHRVEDTITFEVLAVPDELSLVAEDDEDAAAAPADEDDNGAEAAEPTEAATPDEDTTEGGGAPIGAFILGIAIIVIGGVLLVKFLGNKKKTDEAADASDE
ncbi:copper resistance CopC family protein [Natronoglycomyces albus]|uniref:Copper resistance protein CopC n=1 Tax=Natronoglycomyces albus TaxID=2811108 RepID=A0A895XNY9_9ACTN|nr:copper resistance CopC family protein [Natronoglycomyces albus]QSB05482.1 copper resistance protein CopC [Natronoglycomyces albus]